MRWCRRGLPAREDMDWTTKMLLFDYLREAGQDWLEAGLYVGLFSLAEAELGGKRASSARSLRRAKRPRTAREAASGSLDWNHCPLPHESHAKEHADAERPGDARRVIRASL